MKNKKINDEKSITINNNEPLIDREKIEFDKKI